MCNKVHSITVQLNCVQLSAMRCNKVKLNKMLHKETMQMNAGSTERKIFSRPSVAGAAVQTALLFIHRLIERVSHPFLLCLYSPANPTW